MVGVAIVTGAGSGIGQAVTLALHAAGWIVVLAGRRESALKETIERASGNDRLLPIPTDVTDETQVRALFDRTRDTFGRVDLLFNNAGILAAGIPFDRMQPRQWNAVVDVNLNGSFLCAREAVRIMKAQSPRGGRIINNGSVSAHSPRPNSAPYTASKHAITGLTKSIALEGRAFDIACGQIDVGGVATDVVPDRARQADGTLKIEPVIDPPQVAEAVLYMANLPLSANVQFLTLIPTQMALVGRG
jgi:NAD(P)-dependent dehydrogenase (short-subunit alcohol dehydrogenase family)